MSFEDSSRIIPLFYLFSSLFSHSLISIHDNEFFGDPIEGETRGIQLLLAPWLLLSMPMEDREVFILLSLSVRGELF